MTETVERPQDFILEFDLGGTATKFHMPDFGQLAMVQHQARVLTRDGVGADQGARAMSLVYRSIRSWIVEVADKDRMEDLIADGDVTIEDMFSAMMKSVKASNDAETAPTTGPVVRRGRPRKAAK